MCLKYGRIRYILFLLASPILYWPPLLSVYIKSAWTVQKYSSGMADPQGLAVLFSVDTAENEYLSSLFSWIQPLLIFSNANFRSPMYSFSLITKETKG